MASGSEGRGAGGEDAAGVRVGEESDEGEFGGNPIVAKVEGEGDGGVERQRDGLLFVKETDDGCVAE